MTSARHRVTDAVRGAPLRIRLVATVLLLAALGLALAAVATTASLHSFLLKRLDNQLASASSPIAGGAGSGPGQRRFPTGGSPEQGTPMTGRGEERRGLPSPFYVVQFTSAGVADGVRSAPLLSASPPRLPALSTARVDALHGRAFTVRATSGGGTWRVVAHVRTDGTGTVAVATSLDDLHRTVDHVILVESGIGGLVLVLLGLAGYLLIRRSLRPLVAVETTAAAIAAGDLSSRVPQLHPRTEVGRLSLALNGMLTQVEDAFAHERTSQQEARASEERMRRFVADASHELRTPLTSIRGFAELYRMGAAAEGPELNRLMRRIEDEAARMGLLVEDLLLLARLDQQRPLESAPVDLLGIADDVVHDAKAVATDRLITLDVDTGVPAVVIGDEARLRQVLHNLVTNALTHTPGGTPVAVRVQTDVEATPPVAVLEVADAGPGLSEDQRSRVFERFYRTDTSRSRQAGGTGLGLSIAAGLVAAHRGRITVASAVPTGAVFRVELPLRTA